MDNSTTNDSALDILLGGANLTVYRAGLFNYRRRYNFPYRVFGDYDLILIGKGSGTWEIEGIGPCRVTPGTVLMIPPKVRNGTPGPVQGKCSLVGIHFDLRIESGADFFRVVPFKLFMKLQKWRGVFEQGCRIAQEWSGTPKPGRGILVHDLTRALLVELVRHYTRDGLQEIATDERILEVIRRLEEEFAEDISVEDMAEWVDLSSSHLRSLFVKELNRSPIKMLVSRRIREARRLLLGTSLPVNQVAEQVGFHDPLYFSRAFKAAVGMSPLNFRKSSKSP